MALADVLKDAKNSSSRRYPLTKESVFEAVCADYSNADKNCLYHWRRPTLTADPPQAPETLIRILELQFYRCNSNNSTNITENIYGGIRYLYLLNSRMFQFSQSDLDVRVWDWTRHREFMYNHDWNFCGNWHVYVEYCWYWCVCLLSPVSPHMATKWRTDGQL